MLEQAVVRIPLTSNAWDVRCDAATNGRLSLFFFLTAILGTRCSNEIASAIQSAPHRPVKVLLPRLLLRSFASDVLLWLSVSDSPLRLAVRDTQIEVITVPDPVRWIYGQFPVHFPVSDERDADIILTSTVGLDDATLFDARDI